MKAVLLTILFVLLTILGTGLLLSYPFVVVPALVILAAVGMVYSFYLLSLMITED